MTHTRQFPYFPHGYEYHLGFINKDHPPCYVLKSFCLLWYCWYRVITFVVPFSDQNTAEIKNKYIISKWLFYLNFIYIYTYRITIVHIATVFYCYFTLFCCYWTICKRSVCGSGLSAHNKCLLYPWPGRFIETSYRMYNEQDQTQAGHNASHKGNYNCIGPCHLIFTNF